MAEMRERTQTSKASALGSLVVAFQAGDENANDSRNNVGALALGWQNGPRCSTMLPLRCPLASGAQHKALLRAEKRDWEGAEFIEISNTG